MNVIFVCHANIGRSQVAEALFNLRSRHKSSSAGVGVDQHMRENNVVSKTLKDGAPNPHAIPYMLERGVDVSESRRTQLTPEMVNAADLVVVILDADQKVDYLAVAGNVEFWDMADPVGRTQTFADGVFMDIEKKVEELVSRIG